MSGSAFAYLLWHSLRNRILSRIRRARNPRYLLGMVMGAAYMAFFWLRPLVMASRGTASPGNALLVSSIGQGIAVALILAQALYWWVFGGNRLTLAFTPAEVAFMFPAPLSRRSLIGYKLIRAQIAAAFSVALGVVILRRGSPTLPIPLRAIGLWLFFTIPGLHSIGSALVRASWAEHGMQGVRRQRLAIAAVAVVFVMLATGLAQGVHTFHTSRGGGDLREFGSMLNTILSSGTLGVVLWPVRATVAPMLSPTSAAWAHAMPAALAILALHVIWVFRTDTAFEEAALAASAARAARVERFKARRAGVAVPSSKTVAKGTIRLAPSGHPAGAIVWKNVLAFRRRSGFGTLIFFAVAPLGWGAISAWMGEPVTSAIATAALVLVAGIAFFGPLLMRNDLRQDMLNIVALKTLPLSGRTIVVAEVLSVVVPVALVQFVLLGVAVCAAIIDPTLGVTPGQAIAIFVTSLPAVLALEGTLVTILNGAPVLFPAWTRLGLDAATGMEGMGSRMVSLGLILIMLGGMLLLPGGLAAALLYFGRAYLVIAVVAALIIGGAILAAELYAAVGFLGGALERTEPSEVA